MYFSPKTSADGLVFHYDTGNTVRSYLGEPTTNLAYAVNSYLNSNGNWWINAGNTIFNDNDTSIQKPVIPNVDTSNLRIFSSTVTGTGGNQQLGSSIITVSSSTTYSFSIYYYFTGTTMQVQPYVRTAVNNDLLAYFGYNGDTNYLNWPRNKWILLKATVTTQANENGIYMSSYTGDTLGEKLAYFGYQVEQKSHCTPLVLGTRSATQGLKDLTAANTINLSNVSFDSNAQMTFDGTDDYVDVGDLGTIGSTYSIECVFKSTSVTSYKNVFDMNYATYSGVTGNTGPRLEQTSGQGINFIWSGVTNNNNLYNNTNLFAISANTYYHVAFVQNGTTGAMYVNGTLRDQANNAQGYLQTFGDFNIGRGFVLDPSRYFSGNVDMFKIFNRALTADEVARNFNAIKSRFNIG
jgi:hypothetical protein